MNKEIKNIGQELIAKAEHLRNEQIAFINDAMANKKELFTFNNFNKDDGEIYEKDFDESSITDTNPIITIIGWDGTQDIYLIGIKYIEQDNREPYRISFYGAPFDDPTYIKVYDFTDIDLKCLATIVEYITENIN